MTLPEWQRPGEESPWWKQSWNGQMTVKSLGNSVGVEKLHIHVVLYHWRGLSELLRGVWAPSEPDNVKSYLLLQNPGARFSVLSKDKTHV